MKNTKLIDFFKSVQNFKNFYHSSRNIDFLGDYIFKKIILNIEGEKIEVYGTENIFKGRNNYIILSPYDIDIKNGTVLIQDAFGVDAIEGDIIVETFKMEAGTLVLGIE